MKRITSNLDGSFPSFAADGGRHTRICNEVRPAFPRCIQPGKAYTLFTDNRENGRDVGFCVRVELHGPEVFPSFTSIGFDPRPAFTLAFLTSINNHPTYRHDTRPCKAKLLTGKRKTSLRWGHSHSTFSWGIDMIFLSFATT
jgi:hypothetical protein